MWMNNVNSLTMMQNEKFEKERKSVITAIKSCIATHKGGLEPYALEREYKLNTGEDLPIREMGYRSLYHMLSDIPDIKNTKNEAGRQVLLCTSSKTKHLQEMIKLQKDPKNYVVSSKRVKRDAFMEKRNKTRKERHDMNRSTWTRPNRSNNTSMQPPTEENWGRPEILTVDEDFKKDQVCTTPVVYRSQLIGDDYFLQLCIKYCDVPLVRKHAKAAITCGTVQSGQTIKKAIQRLENIKAMANKLVINLGTVDIYNRRNASEMIESYKDLLFLLKEKFGYKETQITICTLPPMCNVGIHDIDRYFNYKTFNEWIRFYASQKGYQLLDFHMEFSTPGDKLCDYSYFQMDARMVSGTIHPHVLWNYKGRQKAMNLLYRV
ncbi:hypothetical protein TKK_0016209 [Trichogramma kaykai]|uniref:HTH OST-type domain-containing protein n=1 Tax=Trichogramma kaykai TaxID=54128 RepID=A0ABD2W7U2_9HYME